MTRLRYLREELGLRQKDIAERLHVTQATLSSWESGKYTPDIDSLYALADMYNSSLDYMLGYSTVREIDVGNPERLIREYLRAKHNFQPVEMQREAIEDVIASIIEIMRMK